MQETFLRFFNAYDPMALGADESAKILYGIAKNVYREWVRQSVSQAVIELDEDFPDICSEVDYDDNQFSSSVARLQIELRRTIEELSPAQRAVMIGRFIDSKTRAEVAAELGISEKHVHVNQRRAITALKKRFGVG